MFLTGLRTIRPEPLPLVPEFLRCLVVGRTRVDGHEYFFDQRAFRSQRTGRVGSSGISSHQESLTAAASKVLGSAIASPAGLRHPLLPAELLKSFGLSPDPFDRVLANIVEVQSGNYVSCVAGQDLSGRLDDELPPTPTSHTGFGVTGIVVRNDGLHEDASRQALLCGRDNL
jgi:hypothetical protein